MKHILQYSLIIVMLFIKYSYGQNSNHVQIIEQLIEAYASLSDDNIDLDAYIQDLEYFSESPININNAERSDLERLHFLSTFQIENLLKYRQKVGQLYSIHELAVIDGFNAETAATMAAFVVFLPPDQLEHAYLNQELSFRYSQSLKKYTDESYSVKSSSNGLIPALQFKYRGQQGDKLKFGLTADHDSGEDFLKASNPYGFDFYSGYLGLKGNKLLKQIYLGDYQVKLGQGLVQWSAYGKRKSSNTTNIRQSGQGLQAYTSAAESNFFRGTALTIGNGPIEFTGYFSMVKADANVTETDSTGKAISVSTLQNSGYHRTTGELEDEKAILVLQTGASVKYTVNSLAIGINGAYINYSSEIQPAEKRYKLNSFSGSRNFNLSTDFLWVLNRINFFGEAALSLSGGKALIAGLEAQPSNVLAISTLFRNYASNFHSIGGTPFSENGNSSNERGIYTGIIIYPIAYVKVSGYLDMHSTFTPGYNTISPIKGTDYLFQTDYSPGNKINMYLRIKSEKNNKKSSEELPVKPDLPVTISHVRYQINWSLNDAFEFRFRAELSNFNSGTQTENGKLLFIDVISKTSNNLSATLRLSWFNTNSYNSRIYAYENDVPHYFYIPAFFDNGLRYYLNCGYKLKQGISFHLKLSQLMYLDKSRTIGSTNTAINNNRKTDLKFLIKYRF